MDLTPEEFIARLDRAIEHTVDAAPGERVSKRVKRPRLDTSTPTHPNKGGWHGHPNSLLALELHRGRTQFGAGGLRTCKKCRDVAVRGLDVCMRHGGQQVVRARRIADNCALYSRARVADNAVENLIRAQGIPLELARTSVWKSVNAAVDGMRDRKVQRSKEEMAFLRAVKLLRFELVRAWMVAMAEDDSRPWATAVGKARELSLI